MLPKKMSPRVMQGSTMSSRSMVLSPAITSKVLQWVAGDSLSLATSQDRLAAKSRTHTPVYHYDIAHHHGNHSQFERQAEHGVVYVFADAVFIFVQLHTTQWENACRGRGKAEGWGCCELTKHPRQGTSDQGDAPFIVLVTRMSWMPA